MTLNLRRILPRLSRHANHLATPSPATASPFLRLPGAGAQAVRNSSNASIILTKNAMPPVGPYSQAIKTPHAIYCSGQLPADAKGNLVQGTMGEKTRACIQALGAVLAEGGSSLEKIVKVQIFLTDMDDFTAMNQEYEKLITHSPARSCVAVKQLPKGANLEIECIALP
ncbi:putative BRT1 protein [Coleophoma cylindrospora]|uniref:Putative BRT1 protein n=1 Tax=Coleophoma cylindrospora TaxID=1849047 RepID=A0A3D8SFW1_9HELO|nr:putative BRT1 protein [Coleophoma cylindrospora]